MYGGGGGGVSDILDEMALLLHDPAPILYRYIVYVLDCSNYY